MGVDTDARWRLLFLRQESISHLIFMEQGAQKNGKYGHCPQRAYHLTWGLNAQVWDNIGWAKMFTAVLT